MATPANLRTIGQVNAKAAPFSKYLMLGGYTFGEWEHPASLEFGVTQKTAVLDAIGGTRQIQTLGAFREEVTWSGYFLTNDETNNPIDKVRAFEKMNNAGNEVILSWLSESYFVVVKGFHHNYDASKTRIVYTITLDVRGDASGSSSRVTVNDVDQQSNNLASEASLRAAAIIEADNSSVAIAAITDAQNAINLLPSVTPIGQSAGSAASQTFLQKLQTGISSVLSYQGGLIPELLQSGLGSGHLLNVNMLLASLQLIQANVSNGQSPLVKTVVGGTLSMIASREYGDSSLWTVLAAVNNLPSNRLPDGVETKVKLPPLTSANSN